jgi:hypothetical protein
VIERLQAFLHRPLRDADRPRLFALAVVLLLAGAAAFALVDRPTPHSAPAPGSGQVPEPAPAAVQLPEAPGPAIDPEAPSEEGKPPAAMQVTRAQVAAVKRAGRRFLAGYLPYSYGQQDAERIPAIGERLRARLRRERPRVPAGVSDRRPQVVLLHADGIAARIGELTALVSDGAHSYSVRLELERAAAGWRVIDVGS